MAITLEKLGQMVADGFDEVKKEVELVDKRVTGLENRVQEGFEHVNARLSHIENDISDIRKHFVYRDEFEDALDRIKYLEIKLGIESGK